MINRENLFVSVEVRWEIPYPHSAHMGDSCIESSLTGTESLSSLMLRLKP